MPAGGRDTRCWPQRHRGHRGSRKAWGSEVTSGHDTATGQASATPSGRAGRELSAAKAASAQPARTESDAVSRCGGCHAATANWASPRPCLRSDLSTSTVTVLSGAARMEAGRELASAGVPMIDTCLLVASQHGGHFPRDLPRAGRRVSQQATEDLPHLRHRHRRRFFPCDIRSRPRNHRASRDSVI